ncbi:MAG: low affinity iron permease family protein [Candidatus Limnocylindrales bacterium]
MVLSSLRPSCDPAHMAASRISGLDHSTSRTGSPQDIVSLAERFNRGADRLTLVLGSLPALVGSVLLVAIWGLTGPIFNFSDTWQLFINTTTTVVTFWMVFVIQNSANRSSKATQLKLDEIIRAIDGARNEFISLDKATEDVLVEREEEFEELVRDDSKVEDPAPRPKGRDVSRSDFPPRLRASPPRQGPGSERSDL